jgi:hypothetical protein
MYLMQISEVKINARHLFWNMTPNILCELYIIPLSLMSFDVYLGKVCVIYVALNSMLFIAPAGMHKLQTWTNPVTTGNK